MLCTCNDKEMTCPIDSAGLKVKTENGFEDDKFFHEQYLTINDGDRKIVISGCSHKGILNIISWLKPTVFIGGFHFMKQDISSKNEILDNAAKALLVHEADYYTCHCTGLEQYMYMKEKMGMRLHYISTGKVITV